MAKRPLSKSKQKQIAKERIAILMQQADQVFKSDPTLANRYIELSRKIAMKVKLRMPREYKRRFCKHCYSYLRSGVNARVRTRDGKLVIYCKECKKFTRIPLKVKK